MVARIRGLIASICFLALVALPSCGDSGDEFSGPTSLRLATTTSTRDSGLLDVLIPPFEEAEGCRVDVVAVGTGAALRLGASGDADVVLVHARSAENEFMAAGHGARHEEFMVNYFMLIGPSSDPAGIRGRDPVEAFRLMSRVGAPLVSRGDDSGTHKREKALRRDAGVESWEALVESGQGMGATLLMADEMNAYVLCDAGTWLRMASRMRLEPLVVGHEALRNPYSVIPVNAGKHAGIAAGPADRFADYLVSRRAQQIIRDYEVEGSPMFEPLRLADRPADH